MSSTPEHAPEHDDAAPSEVAAEPAGEAPRSIPSQEELERIAVDAYVRRRPRFGAFLWAGAVGMGLVGLGAALSVPRDAHANWAATVWIVTLGSMLLGALVGGVVAVLVDSRRR